MDREMKNNTKATNVNKHRKDRAVHRPITINVEEVDDLPIIRDLPQETMLTINLKMTRKVALSLISKIQQQLDVPGGLDHVALTITGTG